MDSNDGRIRLAIPTIDLLECRKFKGGYYDDSIYDVGNPSPEYDDSEKDGGGLDPSIIIEIRDNYDNGDHFDMDDNRDDNQSDYDQYEDDRSGNDVTDGNGDADGSDKGKVVIDDSVPKEMQEQIQSLLNTLPTVISNQDVKIVLNNELLNLLASEKGVEANGLFLHEGYKLPSGAVLQEDTVVLGDSANMSTVQEELIHCWQVNNCFEEGATTNNSLSAMEFQETLLSDILFEITEGVPVLGREDMGTGYDDFMSDCFKAEDGGYYFDIDSFNYDYFIENFMDYYVNWLEYHSRDNDPYGWGNDEHYDWNWGDLLNQNK